MKDKEVAEIFQNGNREGNTSALYQTCTLLVICNLLYVNERLCYSPIGLPLNRTEPKWYSAYACSQVELSSAGNTLKRKDNLNSNTGSWTSISSSAVGTSPKTNSTQGHRYWLYNEISSFCWFPSTCLKHTGTWDVWKQMREVVNGNSHLYTRNNIWYNMTTV